jgi:5-methylcytosine-specific restriction endonuclease McrA
MTGSVAIGFVSTAAHHLAPRALLQILDLLVERVDVIGVELWARAEVLADVAGHRVLPACGTARLNACSSDIARSTCVAFALFTSKFHCYISTSSTPKGTFEGEKRNVGHKIALRMHVFTKTDGNCHICHGTLSFKDYGSIYASGGWEIDHSVPKSKGGSDHASNLFAAHVTCNRRKRAKSTRDARALHGVVRAPHSQARKQQIQNENATGGFFAGAAAGGLVGGPVGAVVGGILGALLGDSAEVPK